MRTTLLSCILLILVLSLSARADDWPNWRGPNYNGISTEPNWIGDWEACEIELPWTKQLGIGCSGVTVANGKLYTMDYIDGTDAVLCMDPNTGEDAWPEPYIYNETRRTQSGYQGGPTSTPTVVDSNVYTLSVTGLACCLNAEDGTLIWEKELATTYNLSPPKWGFAGSPFVYEDLVIYNVGYHGLALHHKDGSLAWKTSGNTRRCGYASPVPYTFDNKQYLVLMGEKTFAAVEAKTGHIAWEESWVTNHEANIADPVVDGNTVFVSTGYSKGASRLYTIKADRIVPLWPQKKTNIRFKIGSPVLWDGYLYGLNEYNNSLVCVRHSDGRIEWNQSGFGNGALMASQSKLIALTNSGELRIIQASSDGYQELGRKKILNRNSWSPPVLANGKIYARDEKGLLACVKLEPAIYTESTR